MRLRPHTGGASDAADGADAPDIGSGELQRLAGVNVSLPSGVEWHPNHGANFLSWVIAESVKKSPRLGTMRRAA